MWNDRVSNNWMMNNWCWMMNYWCCMMDNEWRVNDGSVINVWCWIRVKMNSTFYLHRSFCIRCRFIVRQFFRFFFGTNRHHEKCQQHNTALFKKKKTFKSRKKKLHQNHKQFLTQMIATKSNYNERTIINICTYKEFHVNENFN